jgi:hypothetical protein
MLARKIALETSPPVPLGERKAKLAQVLARAPAGIVFDEHADETALWC